MSQPEGRRTMQRLALLALSALLMLRQGLAADVSFTGSLERVGHESMSVKLTDRRVIDALLSNTANLAPEKIAAQYHMGDQVQITCKPIHRVWEKETSRYQFLEVTRLRFLRPPRPAEIGTLLQSIRQSEVVNLLSRPATIGITDVPPTMAEGMESVARGKLEHARQINLASVASLPNFVADEAAKRYTSSVASPRWRPLDVIETEITFNGGTPVRQRIRKDGKPWGRPFQALPGFKWSGGFGNEIRPLFDPQCPTTIEYSGHAELHGKQLLEYQFSSPPDGCFSPFYFEYQRYNAARTGRAFIDDPAGNLIQLEEDANGFPGEFEFAQRKEEVAWDYVNIGGVSYLVPIGATFEVRYSNGNRARVEVQYKNHRHFEASTNVTFH